MDEMLEMFNSFIGEAFDRENAMAAEFTEFERKLNECVMLANERGTPVQNKKRPKRQASISEKDEEGTSSNDTHKPTFIDGQEPLQSEKRSHVSDRPTNLPGRSSARMLDVTGKGRDDQPPQPMETSSETNESTIRPSRTARLKAQEKLREPPLIAKMRNDGGSATVNIKIERNSSVTSNTLLHGGKDAGIAKQKAPLEQTYVEMETENDVNQANRIIAPVVDKRNDEGFSSATESSKQQKDEPTAAREMSLMVITPLVPKVEILSDEEMPPPSMPPPKLPAPKVRTKKKPAAGGKNKKDNNDTASSSAVSSADSTMDSTNSTVSSNASTTANDRPSRSKSKALVKQSAVQSPRLMEMNVMIEPVRVKTEKLSIAQQSPSGISDKSTYEDAREQPNQDQVENAQLEKQMRPLQIVLEKINPQAAPHPIANNQCDLNETYTQPKPSDGTFVMPPSVQDGTFVMPPSVQDGTFVMPPSVQDGTFVIEKNGSSNRPNAADGMMINASIMTEDESVIENSPVQMPEQPKSKASVSQKVAPPATAPKPTNLATMKKSASKLKKNKELFNPCVMSPIKSRIEAFEKCATTSSKVGTPQAQVGRLLKTVSTPTIGTETHGLVRSAHAKPLGSSVYTPTYATLHVPKSSSASKVSQMQSRALQHATRSQSRDSSWDRATAGSTGTLSAASSTSSLLDEKKKKREEKQRLAAAQREAMEREKREHAERLVREKEEKYRKLVHEKQEKIRIDAQKKQKKLEEFEKRRVMEEQKALADQKRDELAKQLAEQQRIDRELLETLKQNQAKDNHEVKLHKQMYQQKLRQQQQQQQQAAKKKVATAQTELFTFEMIDTDDSTDEEVSEDTSAPRKKKRPPTPEWCQKSANFQQRLTIQSHIDAKVIDGLFSVQPMTPDLRLLFPAIDAHKLKRNSSAIWRTPPRPSEIP
ncbi:inner centromere protein [Anopheles funestus]|uniref:inner centromere protein n=1 Tax=Anopheles funestus TaxID=62324 RepID=UPI0020C6B356|nr:inner centromere protein [Anopheles funestus]